MSAEQIDAIRAVRLAAHELMNVCAAVVGGIPMAISIVSVKEVGKSTRGLSPRRLDKPGGVP